MDAIDSPLAIRFSQTDPREALDAGHMSLAENAFRVRSGMPPIRPTTVKNQVCRACGTAIPRSVDATRECPFCFGRAS